MDNLAALNIVPFLGLMNLVEVKYLHMPEVYRTMLAILCDYDPLSQENIIRTRRYLSVLLAREPELAQCLLNFLDTPEDPAPATVHADASGGSVTDTDENKHCQQHIPQELLTDKTPAMCMQNERVPTTKQHFPEQIAGSQSSEKREVLTFDHKNKCFMSASTTVATRGQTENQQSAVLTEAPMNLQPRATDSQAGYCHHVQRSVPLVNIYHKDVFSSEKSALVVTRTDQTQTAPLFLPGFLTPHLNPIDPLGQDHSTKSSAVSEHKDQVAFTSDLTSSSNQPQTENGKQCSLVQTQTLSASTDRTNLFHDSSPSVQTPLPFQLSRVTPSTSSTETLMTTATSASQQHALTPHIGVSKLLGQPSVAYLPAGHFIDNNNSVVGTTVCRPTGVEKLPYTSSILSGKMNSAAAKLHLLSTQAGNEKSGSFQAGYGKATSVMSSAGSLSTPVTLIQKESTMKTTVKVTSKPGCRKTITLSKIVPVLKLDTLTGQDTKPNTVSYDKQIQVGQRQICKKSKTTDRKEQACHVYEDTNQLASNPSSQQNSQGRQQAVDWQQGSSVHQPSCSTENDTDRENFQNQKETQSLFVGPQKCQMTKKLRANKQKPQNSSSQEGQTSRGKPAASEQKQVTEKLMDQQDHLLPENQDTQTAWEQEDDAWAQTSQAVSSDKHGQQSEHVTGLKPAASKRQKVQVVAMSMGSSSSLSAFPYIQQMILPDGQVSTIAHNSYTTMASGQQVGPLPDEGTDVSISTKPSTATGICQTVQERKEPSSKPSTQIVLPRSQLKLSVSIQTSAVNSSSSSRKRHKNSVCHPHNLPSLSKMSSTTETAQTCSKVTTVNDQDSFCKTSVEKNVLSDATNLLPDTSSTGSSQGKRKRSPSSRRNIIVKTQKLNL